MKTTNLKMMAACVAIGTILMMFSCSPPKEVEQATFLSKKTMDLEDSLTKYKTEGDAHGGKYFTRADSANVYGQECTFNIPDSVQQKDLRVKVNVWARIGNLSSEKKYAFSLEDEAHNVLHWTQFDFRTHVSETNKWVNVIDSVTIPGNFVNKPGMIIKTYAFNPDGKSTLDCDDVEMSLYKIDKVLEK
ncbi:MAG: hypothetical protein HY062_07620 [Bacteroidetes bacterium]|nr:hypothetical protein [Bacteroidota bacterium]